MAIKKKTQLNLSGSHHTLDSDNAFVGGTLYITGALSASTDVSAQGNLFVQGATQLTGAVNLASTLSAANDISSQGRLFVQGAAQITGAVNLASTLSAASDISTAGNLYVQGTSFHTGAAYFGNAVSASGGFTAGASSTFKAATFAGTVSASNNISTAGNLQVGNNAFITGSLQVTGSAYLPKITGSISGTLGGQPFLVSGGNMGGVNYNAATGQWEITGSAGTSVAGANAQIQFNADGVHGASSDLVFYTSSFGFYPAGTLAVPTASVGNALIVAGTNVTPIVKQATTSGPGGTSNISSANFLSFTNTQGTALGNYSVAAFDFTIIAAAQTSDNYASWNFTATGIKDSTGATKLIDYLEVSQGSSGSDGDTWAVNVYDNMSVGLTGSTSQTVQWFMKASMKAALSGSGNDIY